MKIEPCSNIITPKVVYYSKI